MIQVRQDLHVQITRFIIHGNPYAQGESQHIERSPTQSMTKIRRTFLTKLTSLRRSFKNQEKLNNYLAYTPKSNYATLFLTFIHSAKVSTF